MSIVYTPEPKSKIKYSELKSDILSGRIPGLVHKEGESGFVIIDGKGNSATAFGSGNGSVEFSFYNVTDNIPWLILNKLARHYNCEMVDEEGAEGNASDFLSLWQEEYPRTLKFNDVAGGRYGKPVKGGYKPYKRVVKISREAGFKII